MDWRPPLTEHATVEGKPGVREQVPRGHTDLADQTEAALQTRMLIGQAAGILMQRDGLSSDAAFALLVDTSQRTNLKLRLIAQRLVSQVEQQNQAR